MITLPNSDCKALCRYLDNAALVLGCDDKPRLVNQARLMRNMSEKIKRKIFLEDINTITPIINDILKTSTTT